jgi:putative DNA primase/helicase
MKGRYRSIMIRIATARSRKSTKWTNKEARFEDLINRLKEPVITTETLKEYANMPKNKRDEIKDVGGFVGGYLEHGKRKRGSLTHRSIITLDADFATSDLILDLELNTDYIWAYYSTHSHTDKQWRLRLIIPLNRECTRAEYEPLARKVAEELGLVYFDPSTFQPERLMYWPSHSRDAKYMFDTGGDKLLDVDEYLGKYTDYKDQSEWAGEKISKPIDTKIDDPLNKPSVIGAFNRSYTITESIDHFLQNVYEKGTVPNRYTYTKAETANGLVVYDNDLIAYSNHENTDPASDGHGKNAYDLVRIHMFNGDEKAMNEWARTDSKVEADLLQGLLEDNAPISENPSSKETPQGEGKTETPKTNWLKISPKTGQATVNYQALAQEIINENELFYNSNEFLIYDHNKGTWLANAEPFLRHIIQTQKLKKLTSQNRTSNAISAIKDEIITQEVFDAIEPSKIILDGGVYDITEGEYTKGYDPKIRARTKTKIVYDPTARCNSFKRLIGRLYGSESLDYIFQWFGYCLYRGYPVHEMLILVGNGGTGKSTLIDLLCLFVGEDAFTSLQLKKLVNINDRFSRASLVGKTLAFDDDALAANLGDGSDLKALVGGNAITIEPKGKPAFNYRNYAKLLFAMNSLPSSNDTANGLGRRLAILRTKGTFELDEYCRLYGEAKNELSGIFNEAMVGLKKVLADGRFSRPQTSIDAVKTWQKENNTVELFADESLEIDKNAKESVQEVYDKYQEWCKNNGRKAIGKQKFNSLLLTFCKEAEMKKSRSGQNSEKTKITWCWHGVKLVRGIVDF